MSDIPSFKSGSIYRPSNPTLFLILIGLLSLFPALFGGYSQSKYWATSGVEYTDRERLMVARLIARGIGIRVDGYTRALEAMAGQVEAQGSLDPAVLQRIVTAHRSAFSGLAISYVGSREGFSIAVDPSRDKIGAATAGTDYRDRDYYQEVVRTDKTFISNVRMGRRAHVPQVQMAVPIHDAEGRLIAFAQHALDLVDIMQPQVDKISKGVPDLNIVVTDREGRVLAHPEKEARQEMRNLSSLALFGAPQQADGDIRVGADERGMSARAAVVPISIRNLNWRVIAYRSEASLDRQAASAQRQTWGIVGSGFAGSMGLIALSLWGRAKRSRNGRPESAAPFEDDHDKRAL